ncbi:MAG: hypothetical protein AAF851_09310, partial [Myxococcota bacterium]
VAKRSAELQRSGVASDLVGAGTPSRQAERGASAERGGVRLGRRRDPKVGHSWIRTSDFHRVKSDTGVRNYTGFACYRALT